MNYIVIRGARTHNLKNIDLSLPRDRLIVVTGLSGSGKSSLAFDTLYAEGQRRYVESLSAYARQFLSVMEKPDVDHIEGLSPAISIEQKATSHNPRSTVGTITEIYDYLRLLFARVGQPHCPKHKTELKAQTVSQMVDQILNLPKETKIMLLAPVVAARKGEHVKLLEGLRAEGFVRARINGELIELDRLPNLALKQKHSIEVVVDRLKIRDDLQTRLSASLETALTKANGIVKIAFMDEPDREEWLFSSQFSCPQCGFSLSELEPRLFSFNNPLGACTACDGLGVERFFDEKRLLEDEDLSLAEGAIRGWGEGNPYYFSILKTLAENYDFSLTVPYKKLSKKAKDILFQGSGKDKMVFKYVSASGRKFQHKQVFVGIIPLMDKRYKETNSDTVRLELAKYLSSEPCQRCQGSRLKPEVVHILIEEHSIADIASLSIEKVYQFFKQLVLPGYRGEIANKIQKELLERFGFLINVGLDYLSLSRSAETLSGGEAQRIRLASQIGAGLVGVTYILDEPSIGLHQRDNGRLLQTLTRLRDLGNTVIVVEHDEEAIRMADHIVDLGPRAGSHGGEIVAEGTVEDIIKAKRSLTGDYLSGRKKITYPEKRAVNDKQKQVVVHGAKSHNLKNITVSLPVGLLICVTGVSGSGKSTLINHTLYPLAAKHLNRDSTLNAGVYDSVEGLEHFDKVINIDQSPIGRTPRSNPATYTGLFTPLRELFAGTQEARARGYAVGRFSFNVKGGRCEACQGDGLIKVEMHFLPDIYVMCDICHGKRYNRETLQIFYKGKNIHQVLDFTVEAAREFFDAIPVLARKLQTLIEVGLSYIRLGQSATTLSGGEAQRIKLAKELSKRDTGRTLYILDEPTTGLHFHDIQQLLTVLHELRNRGNTLVVIEHNLDVIKTADWLIDLGPEGGDKGGYVLATGTPEEVAKVEASYTGQFLKGLL